MSNYSYHAIRTNGSSTLSPRMPRIQDLRERYFRQAEIFDDKYHSHLAVDEIVVFRGRKIHGFYDENFKLKTDVPVHVHNALFGL